MRRGAVELSLEVPPGECVLVAGPPMTGKYRLVLSLLAANSEGAVVVSTNTPAARVLRDYREITGPVPDDRIGVVDCATTDERTRGVPESETVTYVNSVRNLTRIGVAFTETLSALAAGDGPVGVGLHSVSALLVYTDVETVFKFLQVFTGQARSEDAVCVAAFDTGTGGQREFVEQLFDGVIETRENDAGAHELRVRGLDGGPAGWQRF